MRLATLHSIRHIDPHGPVVILLATGSDPSGVDGFFQSVKIQSMTSFGREVKQWVNIVDLPRAEIRASEQNLSDFSRSVIESDANDLRC